MESGGALVSSGMEGMPERLCRLMDGLPHYRVHRSLERWSPKKMQRAAAFKKHFDSLPREVRARAVPIGG